MAGTVYLVNLVCFEHHIVWSMKCSMFRTRVVEYQNGCSSPSFKAGLLCTINCTEY